MTQSRNVTQNRIEDIEWLVETGEIACRVAARVGMKPVSLVRLLKAQGRDDLLGKLNERNPDYKHATKKQDD